MSKSTKSPVKSPAKNINYLEQWRTRYGVSTRIVTRNQGRIVTQVSFTGLLNVADPR